MVDFSINLVGMDQVMGSNAGFIDLRWEIDVGQERGQGNENNEYSTVQFKFLGDDDRQTLGTC
jgi:hypothetical protein